MNGRFGDRLADHAEALGLVLEDLGYLEVRARERGEGTTAIALEGIKHRLRERAFEAADLADDADLLETEEDDP